MKCKVCHESFNKRMQEYNRRIVRNPEAKISPPHWENVLHGEYQIYRNKNPMYLCKRHYDKYRTEGIVMEEGKKVRVKTKKAIGMYVHTDVVEDEEKKVEYRGG